MKISKEKTEELKMRFNPELKMLRKELKRLNKEIFTTKNKRDGIWSRYYEAMRAKGFCAVCEKSLFQCICTMYMKVYGK